MISLPYTVVDDSIDIEYKLFKNI